MKELFDKWMLFAFRHFKFISNQVEINMHSFMGVILRTDLF